MIGLLSDQWSAVAADWGREVRESLHVVADAAFGPNPYRGRLATPEEKAAEHDVALEYRVRTGPPPAVAFGPEPEGSWLEPSDWNQRRAAAEAQEVRSAKEGVNELKGQLAVKIA